MTDAIRAKFSQNAALEKALLATSDSLARNRLREFIC
jgi:predicted NAD-dependent protein-ADP-ribosyltransferase YbiA (DUF1768 family)